MKQLAQICKRLPIIPAEETPNCGRSSVSQQCGHFPLNLVILGYFWSFGGNLTSNLGHFGPVESFCISFLLF